MRDQIKNLSRSQKLTACQIANHLHVSQNLVVQTLKDEFSCLHYQFRIEYLGHEHKGNAEPLKGWFREIQVKGDMTLNGLNDCIQHVLGWDNPPADPAEEARVGTVDKFQRQEAEVVIISLATSSGDYLPRFIEFLYSRNRLNVAISRARCLAILVANPALMTIRCTTPEQMALVNTLCWVQDYSDSA